MDDVLFSKIDIKKENTFFPDDFYPYEKYDKESYLPEELKDRKYLKWKKRGEM